MNKRVADCLLPNRAIDPMTALVLVAFWVAAMLVVWIASPFATLPTPPEVWAARGTLDRALDVLRQNAAMGWAMITMVEGISRAEGGVGAMILNQNKHFLLAEVYAILLVILLLGLFMDWGMGALTNLICPYSAL